MKIGIVGQGAIGSLLAYYYQLESPTLLLKNVNNGFKNILTQDGSLISLKCQTIDVSQGSAITVSTKHFDAIIIAVKGYQMSTLIAQLLPWVPLNTRLVLIQNGMGAQLLAKAFPKHRIYTGTTTDAVYSIDENTYQITATGKLDIGPLWKMSSCNGYTPKIINPTDEEKWLHTFISFHPNAKYHEDVAQALYTKLAVNAVINSLTAILQIKNGQLQQHSALVNSLKAEIFEVYKAANIEYLKNELSKVIDEVIMATSNNWSSMQQDVEHHRHTENETVLGYILTLATLHNVPTPLAKKLYMQLKKFDSSTKTLNSKKAQLQT